jgi:hypothetical protein
MQFSNNCWCILMLPYPYIFIMNGSCEPCRCFIPEIANIWWQDRYFDRFGSLETQRKTLLLFAVSYIVCIAYARVCMYCKVRYCTNHVIHFWQCRRYKELGSITR